MSNQLDSLGVPLKEGYVMTNAFTALKHPQNKDTINKLAVTSALMAVFPIGTFIYVRSYVIPNLSVSVGPHRDLISFLCALFIIQLIIAFYVYSAFTEKDDDEESTSTKKNQ